jgi:UTP--glucose-1-phosphate uridylyltransferase
MITKAIIPAAGLGTRFLPVTKAQAKEMLPIIDTPAIQYVVQEAVDSGIKDILIITGRGKRAIEDYFDRNMELEAHLESHGEAGAADGIRRLSEMANIHFVRQKTSRGLGDALLYARQHTGDEPFAVLLGDTVIDSTIPVTRQLMDAWEQHQQTIIAVEELPVEKLGLYGVVGGNRLGDRLLEVTDLVEKPDPGQAPSNRAVAGRYILTPGIYPALDQTPLSAKKELQLTDALRLLLDRGRILALTIEGRRYDIGDMVGYIRATIEFSLKREGFAEPMRRLLEEIGGSMAGSTAGDEP